MSSLGPARCGNLCTGAWLHSGPQSSPATGAPLFPQLHVPQLLHFPFLPILSEQLPLTNSKLCLQRDVRGPQLTQPRPTCLGPTPHPPRPYWVLRPRLRSSPARPRPRPYHAPPRPHLLQEQVASLLQKAADDDTGGSGAVLVGVSEALKQSEQEADELIWRETLRNNLGE